MERVRFSFEEAPVVGLEGETIKVTDFYYSPPEFEGPYLVAGAEYYVEEAFRWDARKGRWVKLSKEECIGLEQDADFTVARELEKEQRESADLVMMGEAEVWFDIAVGGW